MANNGNRTEELLNQILTELKALKEKPVPENEGIMKEASTLFLGSLVGAIMGFSIQYVFAIHTLWGVFLFALVIAAIGFIYSIVVVRLLHYVFRKKKPKPVYQTQPNKN